jgi:hypothetical protein
MEPNVIGILPPPQAEHRGFCGSFSFRGGSDLYVIWEQPAHPFPTAAWFRSVDVGDALISFHPYVLRLNDDGINLIVFRHLALAAVPPPEQFRIDVQHGLGQPQMLLPVFHR